MKGITFKTTKRISPRSVQRLFRCLEFSDWWTLKDVEWYLNHAVFVVSAWHGRKLAGIGVLVGDGRIQVEIGTLLVDEACQRRGIGTQMLTRIMKKVESLKPYWCQVATCPELGEALYRKFGFDDGHPIVLNHAPTSARWRAKANRDRIQRRKRSGRREPAWRR